MQDKRGTNWTEEEVVTILGIGGFSLMSPFIGANRKMDVQCANGHLATMSFYSINRGSRCSECFGNKRLTLEKVRTAFETRGYHLLEEVYINNHTNMAYLCNNGHLSKIRWGNFYRGHGCSHCIKNHVNPETNTKVCSECGTDKTVGEYYFNKDRSNRIRPQCKVCTKRRAKRSFQDGVPVSKHRDNLHDFLFAHLSNNPCRDCSEKDVLVLEFDHVRGKKLESVSVLVAKSASLSLVKNEVAKCEVVCANCHRRRTYLRQNSNWRVTRIRNKTKVEPTNA